METNEKTPFEGWVILELMGHRRRAGFLREEATITAPRFFPAASWPRERFYFSCDQLRSAGVAPHSWESEEPVADRERWKVRKVTHHGFKGGRCWI